MQDHYISTVLLKRLNKPAGFFLKWCNSFVFIHRSALNTVTQNTVLLPDDMGWAMNETLITMKQMELYG